MIPSVKPVCIEPGFKIYYFDIVYSYPQVLEIDLLITFRGGIVAIELERNGLKNAIQKSLKYFVNGLARYPVVYCYKSIEDSKYLSSEGISAPIIVGDLKLGDQDFFEMFLKDYMQIHDIKEKERAEIFSIDNFLCSLLIYGAPIICEKLLTDIFMKHVIESSNLIQQRIKVINEVKRLKINFESKHGRNISSKIRNSSYDSTSSDARTIIIFIPKLENEKLRARIADHLKELFKNPSVEKVRILYTERSCEHAIEIISRVGEEEHIGRGVELKFIKVEVNSISTKIRELVDKEPQKKDVMVLIVGEFPKRELLKLVEIIRPHTIECKLLMWRPKQKSLHEVIKNIRECSLGEVERLELRAVSLY
ncbi:MAG: hypothetical protein LZ173_09755 [Thaumarchaeota archaeon]|jgi:hypothetical protein|nr:hypothetical protein [Candidatus Geocrenenecus arthurdayi]